MTMAAIPYIMAVSAAASATVGFVNSKRAGQQVQIQLNEQAKADADNARAKEVDRRRALVQALASMNAASGGTSGAYTGQARRDITDATNDLASGRINAQRRQASLRSQGRFARQSANSQAIGGLFDSASSAYSNGFFDSNTYRGGSGGGSTGPAGTAGNSRS